MQVYRASTPVTVTFPLDGLAPIAAEYEVRNEEGEIVVPSESLTISDGQQAVAVAIAPVANSLPIDSVRAMRVVKLTLVTAVGSIERVERYIVEAAQTLVIMENTYQTFESALLEAIEMPTLKAWPTKAEGPRRAALVEAFHRLGKLKYRVVKGGYTEDELSRLEPVRTQFINDLNERSLSEFLSFPSRFRQALRRAQIAEADIVLEGDIIGDRRRDGLLSESIGESSMMFRSGKPVILPVSNQALRYLQGYVSHSVSLTRS
ncbi:hypothetical protein [Magnetospirillum molischianum]|uniref:Uncharacterized protein n=1 Tax=Magnetospirillum molischianum DSM 120 TaxID=1150626 RepID=H8FY50_MAGML|nr:hypothetical protein [Magnetospirillum molischianum]CCG43288.1 hypothetical protein PHAMO_80079 [Magnetospirillum molischianum DSM 120]